MGFPLMGKFERTPESAQEPDETEAAKPADMQPIIDPFALGGVMV